jgi:hypothetical protein|nr:MAG TPA: hypothetical protein [Caudoviricetes sp.]
MKLIQIIERNCSDKIQSNIAINQRYFADETDPLKDGTKCLLIRENKNSKAHKINAKRFKWREVEAKQVQQELLSSKYSVNELAHQVIMPIVIYNIAIVYVEKLLKELAEKRIPDTIKLSRTMKMLIQEWRNMLDKHQDKGTVNLLDDVLDAFMSSYYNDAIKFFHSVNNAIKRENRDFPYKDASTYAIIALQILNYANDFLNGISSEVKGVINGKKEYITSPQMDKLMSCIKECVDAGAGNIKIEKILQDECVKLNIGVLHNSLKKITFEDYLNNQYIA